MGKRSDLRGVYLKRRRKPFVIFFIYIYIYLSRNVSFFLFFERSKLDDTKLIEKWKLNIRKQR